VLDFEVAHYEEGEPDWLTTTTDMLLACWRMPNGKYKSVWADEFGMQELTEDLKTVDFFVAHFTKFELGWLKRCGCDIDNILPYCTMLGEYVRAGNRRNVRLGLEESCKRYGIPGKISWVSKLIKSGVCPSKVPCSDLEKYCKQDVKATYELFLKQRELLTKRGLLPVTYTRNILTPVLVDIESRGMHVDKDILLPIFNEVNEEHQALLKEMDEFTGGINPNSPPQVASFMYDTLGFEELKNRDGTPKRTDAGNRSVNAKTVVPKLKATTPKQKQFLKYKAKQSKLQAAVSKTLRPLKRCVEETDDAILYAKFNQTTVATHRLSSSGKEFGCQFQNFPRAYKKVFNSRYKDWLIGEIDSAKLEFVVAAHIYQDEQAIQDILTGKDAHNVTGSYYSKYTEQEFIDYKRETGNHRKERTEFKPQTFRPLFSSGLFGNKKDKAYAKYFKERYYTIEEGMKKKIQEAYNTKKLVAPTGLITYWNLKKTNKPQYYEGEEVLRNIDIQGLGADMMQICTVYMYHKTKHMQSFIINQVHDSNILETHPEEKEEIEKIGLEVFTKDVELFLKKVYNIDFTPGLLAAEWSFNTNWSYDK